MKSKLLLITTLALLSTNVFGQSSVTKYGLPKPSNYSRFSVGLYGGIALYHGDVRERYSSQNSSDNYTPQASYGLQLGYQFAHSIGLQLKFGGTKFNQKPSDSVYIPELKSRYLVEFESPVTEGSLNFNYSFGNISFLKRNSNLHFVVSLGLGLMTHESTITNAANGEILLEDGNLTEIIVPFGFGVKYKVGKLDLGLLFDYNKMFTDNVDGLKEGNSYDGYSHLNLAINYTIGKKPQMEWVNPVEMIYNDISDMKQKVDNLTNDKDKDGVADLFDKDNSTPDGKKVYGDGTTVDTDIDGIPDFKDMDPYSIPGAKVDASGREIDTDTDGVGDSFDKEPNTPAGNLVNFQGISILKSGSGSNTSTYTKEIVNNNGGLGFLPSVFFDLGKANVKAIYYERLLLIARVMKMNPDLKITIVGSTDQKGKNDSNKKLGQSRADNIKQHLVTVYGIDPNRLSASTIGMDEPFAKPTKAFDNLNRRVDFRVNITEPEKK